MGWILSLRPLASGLSTLLVVYAYLASGAPVNILTCVCVFILTGTTMAWNDWCDRHHDAKFGKTFALSHGAKYLWYCIGLWFLSTVLIGLTAIQHWQAGLVGLGIAVAGLLYTYSRNIIILPEIMCATCLTAVVFYPMTEGYSGLAWYLYLFTGFGLIARENIKNTDHPIADIGWKKTLSVFFGNRTAIITARFFIGFTVMMGLLVSAHTSSILIAGVQTGGMLMIALAGHYLLSSWFPVARNGLDLGVLVFLTGGMMVNKTTAVSLITGDGLIARHLARHSSVQPKDFPEWQPERIVQPAWVWPVMITLLFVVVAGLRFITATAQTTRIFIAGNLDEAITTGAVVVVIFLILFFTPFFAPAFDEAEQSETRGYRIVKRMSSGLLLGAVCSVIGGHTLLAPAIMFIICVVATIWYPTACWALKQRGFQLGTIVGFALIGGIGYAVPQFLYAYIPVVIFYYAWTCSRRPVSV